MGLNAIGMEFKPTLTSQFGSRLLFNSHHNLVPRDKGTLNTASWDFKVKLVHGVLSYQFHVPFAGDLGSHLSLSNHRYGIRDASDSNSPEMEFRSRRIVAMMRKIFANLVETEDLGVLKLKRSVVNKAFLSNYNTC
ncbi:hypothetical protein VNO77_26911 [Canavalia gladiata]|uniref:Uncharacterized protein n=1 Tax=Canavalia gladiata TaxID=3824 RepID=A0AAN9KWV1_CANGL